MDPDSIPLFDEHGTALFDQPMFNEDKKRIYDEYGRPCNPTDSRHATGKLLVQKDGTPLLDGNKKPLFFKDGHRVVGKPLYDNNGNLIFDKNLSPLYGKPVYGVVGVGKLSERLLDCSNKPMYLRPVNKQPVCDKNGLQLRDKTGELIVHKDGIPFFDKNGEHLHGQPVFDKDENPLYNYDGRGAYDIDGHLFYYVDGQPVIDKHGNPLFDKPAYDKDKKQLLDKSGKTLYGKDFRPLYWEDVYDKDGKPFSGELFYPVCTSIKVQQRGTKEDRSSSTSDKKGLITLYFYDGQLATAGGICGERNPQLGSKEKNKATKKAKTVVPVEKIPEDFDHTAALLKAISHVTEFNPDLSLERIEYSKKDLMILPENEED
uniref:Uncharacterized protein n=1 Tax=Biomphalaria glabrata TaxID=6526 RepID=A0A2C9M5U5_BIOGL